MYLKLETNNVKVQLFLNIEMKALLFYGKNKIFMRYFY